MEKRLSRRNGREWAVQMLTAADLNPPDSLDEFIAAAWPQIESADELPDARSCKALRAFAEERVRGVMEKRDEIDAVLAPLLEEWTLERLGTVERAVMRLGIWEMKYGAIPPPVAINEAVDLTNWFSTPKSRSLVNGVLDRYAKSAR